MNQFGLCLSQLPSVASINGNVAQSCRAVVLDVDIWGREELYEDWYCTCINQLLAILICERSAMALYDTAGARFVPECVMFSRAPVAFRCTLISLDFASRVRGPKAPDRAIFALFSSWVAKFVMHPTALHWTSTFGDSI
jgi:hypothetical protein